MVKPVYIYADEGTSQLSVDSVIISVEQKLRRKAIPITAEYLIQQGFHNTDLFIMPGGADLPYCKKLNGEGNQIIRQFVEHGGNYIGICAGAYYACQQVDFIGKTYQVKGERELAFFHGIAKGSWAEFTQNKLYDDTAVSKSMVRLNGENISQYYYYHGGCAFLTTLNNRLDCQVIAYYPNHLAAIIKGRVGRGQYLLSGVHFELQQAVYERQIIAKCDDPVFRTKEEQLIQYFDEQYGNAIWQRIKLELLNE